PLLESAQNGIGGGGRYDGLTEQLGGPPTPGIGFGIGIERVLLACEAEAVSVEPLFKTEVFIIDTADGDDARNVSFMLRDAGFVVERAFDRKSMKAQLRSASRSGARWAVIA